jgi:hypothetical protein
VDFKSKSASGNTPFDDKVAKPQTSGGFAKLHLIRAAVRIPGPRCALIESSWKERIFGQFS